jgi:hypothetical protein
MNAPKKSLQAGARHVHKGARDEWQAVVYVDERAMDT